LVNFGVTDCFYRLSPGVATDAASLEKAMAHIGLGVHLKLTDF
jgi:hypothetical protein